MKKSIKASVLLLSAITLLTACSGENPTSTVSKTITEEETHSEKPEESKVRNPVVGTVAEEEIPSKPILPKAEPQENLEELKAKCPVQTFTGELGETIPISDVVYIDLSESETDNTNSLVCNCSLESGYFTYAAPVYKRGVDFADLEKGWLTIDTKEKEKEYSEYYEDGTNHGNGLQLYSVSKGDTLENGLICTDAKSFFFVKADGSGQVFGSEVCFSGELTLTGTIKHTCTREDEPFLDEGTLIFYPDRDNGNIPLQYGNGNGVNGTAGEPSPDNISGFWITNQKFTLRPNLYELPEEYASLIKDNEYTNVEVTIKDIHLCYADYKTDPGSDAELVSLKVI